MENIDNIMQLCRLCLVKEQVNTPIFGQNNDLEEISAKIRSCLPVKVSPDDSLPKKICDGCSYKLDLLYVFRNTSINSEKQLYQWLEQAGITKTTAATATTMSTPSITATTNPTTPAIPSTDPIIPTIPATNTTALDNIVNDAITKSEISVKQEKSDSTAGSELSAETQEYLLQQQKLPYQESFGDFNTETNSAEPEEPARKKLRRAAASKPPIKDNESDPDMPPTKAEDDSDEDMDDMGDGGMDDDDDDDEEEEEDGLDHPEFVDVPSTSAEEQPGPSGVNKDPIAAPDSTNLQIENDVCILEEIDLLIVEDDDETDDDDEGSSSDRSSKNKTSLCELCGNKYSPNYICRHHKKIHASKKLILCHYCGDIVRKEMYANHEKSHGNCCEICPAVFDTPKELDEHKKTHGDTVYECDKCPLTFTTPFELVLHNREHNGLATLQCCKCQFSTKKLQSMRDHLRRHEETFNYVCDICSKRFYRRLQLNAHKQIHQPIPKFVCEFCTKKFTSLRYLNNHRMFNHSKELTGVETSYVCKECGRTFKFAVSLKRHLSTIHDIGECRRVACPVCNKIIANRYNLKMHMRTHTGEKLYVCDLCGRRLSSLKNWKKHVQTQHSDSLT